MSQPACDKDRQVRLQGSVDVSGERRNVPVNSGGVPPPPPGQVAVPGGAKPRERGQLSAGGKLDP